MANSVSVAMLSAAMLSACGAPAARSTTTTPGAPAPRAASAGGADRADRPLVDPIAALKPYDKAEASSIIPGPIALELGQPELAGSGGKQPIEVTQIDREGDLVRVAVRREHLRFSVWIARKYLLPVLKHDQRIAAMGPPPAATFGDVDGGPIVATLRAGAVVQRIGHRDKDKKTQIRYSGALEVEGWVADAELGERGPARDHVGKLPTGRPSLMVLPGSVIRSEPRWAGDINQLALVANGYALDQIKEVDASWVEVVYEDGDVRVHGYVSRHDPPGRLHRARDDGSTQAVAPNAVAASGTCLYARPGGEPIGYVVGSLPVELDDNAGRAGWLQLTTDTPWGPLAFAVKGASKSELAACAPPGSVPPPPTAPATP
jgi:hypothetical protein